MVELIVAMVITSTCLLGVYSVFQQSLEVQRNLMTRSIALANARAVVDEIADALEHAVALTETESISASTDQDGRHVLAIVVSSGPMQSRGRLEHRRYVWNAMPPLETGTIELSLQRRLLAGSRHVDALAGTTAGVEEVWAATPAAVIASGLSSLSVQLRARNGQGEWNDQWSGMPSQMQARVAARVGEFEVERIVIGHVTASFAGQSD